MRLLFLQRILNSLKSSRKFTNSSIPSTTPPSAHRRAWVKHTSESQTSIEKEKPFRVDFISSPESQRSVDENPVINEWKLKLEDACKLGELDNVHAALESLKSLRVYLPVDTAIGYKLKACLAAKDSQRAYSILLTLSTDQLCNGALVKLALLACSAAGDPDTAEKCIAHTRSRGVETTLQLWSALLGAYAEVGDLAKCIGTLKLMDIVYKLKPNTSCFNKALKAAMKQSNFEDAQNLIEQMKSMNVPMDEVTLPSYIHCAIAADQLDEAMEILDAALKEPHAARGYRLQTTSFHLIMKCLLKKDESPGAVERLFETMVSVGVAPDAVTYHYLFLELSRGAYYRAKLVFYVKDMMQNNVRFSSEKDWRALSNHFVSKRDAVGLIEIVDTVFYSIGSQGLISEMFRDLITIFGSQGLYSKASNVLKTMQIKYQIEPSKACFEKLASIYAKSGDWATALRLLRDMAALGLKADLTVWAKVLRARFNDATEEPEAADVTEFLIEMLQVHACFDAHGAWAEVLILIVSMFPRSLDGKSFLGRVLSSLPEGILTQQMTLESIIPLLHAGEVSIAADFLRRTQATTELDNIRAILATAGTHKDCLKIYNIALSELSHLSIMTDASCVASMSQILLQSDKFEVAYDIGKNYLKYPSSVLGAEFFKFFDTYLIVMQRTGRLSSEIDGILDNISVADEIDQRSIYFSSISALLDFGYIKRACDLAVSITSRLAAEDDKLIIIEDLHCLVLTRLVKTQDFETSRSYLERICKNSGIVSLSLMRLFLEEYLITVDIIEAQCWLEEIKWCNCSGADNASRELVVWEILLGACSKRKLDDSALWCMDRIRRSGSVKPNSSCWTHCLSALCSAGRLVEAVDCLQDMYVLDDVEPSREHFSVVLHRVGTSKEFDLGLRCVELMRSQGLTPQTKDWEQILIAAIKAKELKLAKSIAFTSIEEHKAALRPGIGIFKYLLSFYAKENDLQAIIRLVKELSYRKTLASQIDYQEVFELVADMSMCDIVFDVLLDLQCRNNKTN